MRRIKLPKIRQLTLVNGSSVEIKDHSWLLTETLIVIVILKCNKSFFCYTILALPVVCDIDFIVITQNILRSVKDIPIVKPEISLYRRSLYRGSSPYILL